MEPLPVAGVVERLRLVAADGGEDGQEQQLDRDDPGDLLVEHVVGQLHRGEDLVVEDGVDPTHFDHETAHL